MSQVETIGSIESVNFPQLRVKNVPAKIDTGAEGSSVWASEISVDKGYLRFTFSAQGNALYSGKSIKTKEYRTTAIKNSFGEKEFRYKVPLAVNIGKRKIRAWFSLSDRSGMSYPVLLGRNILRSKYVVDVSKHQLHSRKSAKKQVLIIATRGEDFTDFFKQAESNLKTKGKVMVRSVSDLAFMIEPGKVKVTETKTNKDIGDFELVYFKSRKPLYPVTVASAQYLQFKGVKVIDKELLTHIAYDKLSEYMKLALHNIPIPVSFCASSTYVLKNMNKITKKIGWPLVCKEVNEDRGRKNYLIKNKKELKALLENTPKNELYVLQPYIPNEGYIRAMVFDREVYLAIQRDPTKHRNPQKQHLNNPAGSTNARLLEKSEITPEIQDLAIRSAETMNRQIAGVDIIQDTKDKTWYVVEVNNSPQLKTSSFVEEKQAAFAKFIDTELNR